MAESYDAELHYQAQEHYCVERLTYSQVADLMGISVSTLKSWGKMYDWKSKRIELARAQADIRADTVMARSAMLKELISTKDPQVAFAVGSLEKLAMDQAEAERKSASATVPEHVANIEINNLDDAVKALKTGLESKIKHLLSRGEDINVQEIAGIKKAFDLLNDLTPKDTSEAARKKGFGKDHVAMVRQALKGVVE